MNIINLPARSITLLAILCTALAGCAVSKHPQISEHLAKAKVLFAQHCQMAGERIYRVVNDVDGVYLLKIRPNGVNYANQFALTDPYGHDLGGDGYIGTFLKGSYLATHSNIPDSQMASLPLAYKFVEAIDLADGKRYRYTGDMQEVSHVSSPLVGGDGSTFKNREFVLKKTLSSTEAPRYGVTYDDISTNEDREYWIAGSSLKIIDLQKNEIIAERIGYMMDARQGSTVGGRAPWLFAADHACPSFYDNPAGPHKAAASTMQADQTDRFVEKVLKPKN